MIRKLKVNEETECEKILRSLTEWFGIEEAIIAYINNIKNMLTYVYQKNEKIIGFITINKHNIYSAEIQVMGIYKEFHRYRIGTEMIKYIENILKSEGVEFLQVKTLGESHPDTNYAKTRKFYFSQGFRPLEEIKEIWGIENPCLIMIKKL